MKDLVVFYSRDGVTRTVAVKLAEALSCPAEELIDLTNRKGILGWLYAGRDGMKKSLTKLKPAEHDPSAYDNVVVGGPIWAGNICPAVRTYLTMNRDKIRSYSLLFTKSSSETKKAVADCEATTGKKALSVLDLKMKEVKSLSYLQKVKEFAAR